MAEIALLKEEIRIKDARLLKIDARRRPHYPPTRGTRSGEAGNTCRSTAK
jgi:hypothetical protein